MPHHYHYLKYLYLSFFVWLISLSIIPSQSIHEVTNGKISFFFMDEQYSCVCEREREQSLSTHVLMGGHIGCFHILTDVNNATMNIKVHISFLISALFSLDEYPAVELLDMVVLFLTFWGIPILFSIVADHFTFPPTVPKASLYSISSPTLVTCCLSDNSHSGWQLYVIFGKMSVQILHTNILTFFLPIFISVLCVFIQK